MISLTMTGADRLRVRLDEMAGRAGDLSQPLVLSGTILRDAAVVRIKNQGGDQSWPPNKRGGHTGIDTGRMWQSIAVEQTSATSVQVGTNVRYARWFQFGRGAFDLKAKPPGSAYRFTIGGEVFFRRGPIHVGAQPARPFLLITDIDREKIRAIFSRWILAGETNSP